MSPSKAAYGNLRLTRSSCLDEHGEKFGVVRAPWRRKGAADSWLLAGCGKKLETGARDVFVKKVVCPADRVSVSPQPDVAPHTVYAAPARTPSAEIAADPGRLALWKSQQPATVDVDAIAKSYKVTGCGQTALYACAHPRIDGGDGPFSVSVSDGHGHHQESFNTTYYVSDPSNYEQAGGVLLSAIVCVPARP